MHYTNVMLFQCVGDCGPAGRRPVSAAYLPADASAEVGAVYASPATPAGGLDENNGQCCHLLYAADAIHLYLQVSEGQSPFLQTLPQVVHIHAHAKAFPDSVDH